MKKQSLNFFKQIGLGPVCLLAMVVFTITACSDDDNGPVVHDPFTLDLSLSSGAKDTTFTFTTYEAWKASVVKGDFVEIVTSKSGNAGEVSMKIRVGENTTFADRQAELRINDGRVNVVKINQKAAKRAVNFSKNLEFVQTGSVFTDTIVVTSNADWTVKTPMPEWVKEWKKLDAEQSPQEGVETTITIVFIADNDKFTPAPMTGKIEFADTKGEVYPLDAKFAGFTPYIHFDVKKLKLERSESDGSYKGKVIVTSNVAWVAEKGTDALWVADVSTPAETGNALETENVIWMTMDGTKLDTDPLAGKIGFKNENLGLNELLDVEFVGTGTGYVEFEREKIFDKRLAAEAWLNGGETPNPEAMIDFNVYAADHAAYEFIILKTNWGIPQNMPAWWFSVEESAVGMKAGRSAITPKAWTLKAYNNTSDQERFAMLFIVPAGMEIEELFDESGEELKEEWREKGTLFGQKGMVKEYFLHVTSGITDDRISMPVEGGKQDIIVETDCMSLSTLYDGDFPGPDVWAHIDFAKLESEGKLVLTVDKNDTGVSRSVEVTFTAYRGDSVEDQKLYTFTIVQGK